MVKRIDSKRIDLVGKEFGALKVIRLSDERGPGNTLLWECLCRACGDTKLVLGISLRAGHYTSCGCIRDDKRDEGLQAHIEADSVDGTRVSALKAKLHRGNKSGHKGVRWDAHKSRWKAYIGFQGKNIQLGSYLTIEEAIAARKVGEEKYHKPYLIDEQQPDIGGE